MDEVALVLEAAPLDDVALVHRGVHALPARVLPRHGHANLFGDAPLDLQGTFDIGFIVTDCTYFMLDFLSF